MRKQVVTSFFTVEELESGTLVTKRDAGLSTCLDVYLVCRNDGGYECSCPSFRTHKDVSQKPFAHSHINIVKRWVSEDRPRNAVYYFHQRHGKRSLHRVGV